MIRVVGIDPGLSGALALLVHGQVALVCDLPTMELRGGKRQLNCRGLAEILKEMEPDEVVVEQVGSMPRQGVSSVFSFGMTYGMIQGVTLALNLPLHLITPQTWKKHFGLINSEKDAARSLAIQRFPEAARHLDRKKDVDRADAILIAAYHYKVSP
jgi:crossover junction endodeoxyribonuclease RuvC